MSFSTGNLDFSMDTVVFDTVFTTIGSTTQRLKIYNNANQTLKIDEIQLLGGSSSPFRINVDGLKGTDFAGLEMEKGDSLFIFVEVTVQVNNSTQPMVIEDKIRFRTNGKDQFVQLVVWGQDMYYHNKDINSGTWPNDKPHLIYGYAGIDSAQTLNIQAGTQIYLHKGALLYNYKGTLNISGTASNKVVLQGDRLESYYQTKSGQYYGIYMQEARPSTIQHVEIKNGTAGIHLFSKDPTFSGPTLTLSNSEIFNNSSHGIFIYAGAYVKAENCIIHKNGSHALIVLEGGDFDFNYCHLIGFASAGQTPAVGINNYYKPNGATSTNIGNINIGRLTNCVITGNQLTELVFDTSNPNGTAVLNFLVRNCLVSSEEIPTASWYQNILWNQLPGFLNISENNYKFTTSSPLNGAADPAIFVVGNSDFEGLVFRDPSTPDIGAYEIF
jgi:hypothetical protein